jgi:hypothetical protein
VTIKLMLGDVDEFAGQMNKIKGEINILQSYEEVVNDPVYGPQWHDAIKLKIQNLIHFGTWEFVR